MTNGTIGTEPLSASRKRLWRASTKRAAILLAGLFLTLADPLGAQPIPPGPRQGEVNLGSVALQVFTYRPNCPNPALLLVFHGLSRTAENYRNYAEPIADRACMLVVAPLFDAQRFPDSSYQHGGIVYKNTVQNPQLWTGQLLFPLIGWVNRREGHPLDLYMIGHSGGGQFLSRLAAFVPTPARRIVVANPSTHVLPTLREMAPYGMGGVYPRGADEAELRRYLATPVTLFLGQEDVLAAERDDSAEAVKQGVTRIERGRNTFAMGQALARSHGWAFNWRLVELPGVGHSAHDLFGSEQALQALRP